MKKPILIPLILAQFLSVGYADLAMSSKIERLAKNYLGGKYTWGGTSPRTGMDCSGYTQFVFKKVGIKIPRTALSQSKIGKPIDSTEFKKGDLLFFLTDKKRGIPVTHVGIYLDNNKFIHAASSKKGIIISSLSGKYGEMLVDAKRILNTQTRKKLTPKVFDDAYKAALNSPIKISLSSFSPIKVNLNRGKDEESL